MSAAYSLEVVAAASRVASIFNDGCDRCDAEDLNLLHEAGLMTRRRCTKEDAEQQDSVEAGETLFEFNVQGAELVKSIRAFAAT